MCSHLFTFDLLALLTLCDIICKNTNSLYDMANNKDADYSAHLRSRLRIFSVAISVNPHVFIILDFVSKIIHL